MQTSYMAAMLARRGLLAPGLPNRVVAQYRELRVWGYGLGGELRSTAARAPRAVAIVDEARGELTYSELLTRAQRLGLALRRMANVNPGDRVGLMCRNHAGMVESMLAASMLGADTVLINTGISGQQLATTAEELRMRVLIHDREFTEQAVAVPARGYQLAVGADSGSRRPRPRGARAEPEVLVERFDEHQVEQLIQTAPPGNLRPPATEGRTIALTSGTTGRPKGARRPTPPGLGPLASILGRIPLRAGDPLLIAAPLLHTWGYAALQVALALRARIVLQRRFDPIATVQAAMRHGVRRCLRAGHVAAPAGRAGQRAAAQPPGGGGERLGPGRWPGNPVYGWVRRHPLQPLRLDRGVMGEHRDTRGSSPRAGHRRAPTVRHAGSDPRPGRAAPAARGGRPDLRRERHAVRRLHLGCATCPDPRRADGHGRPGARGRRAALRRRPRG
jgi:hypothetical protein